MRRLLGAVLLVSAMVALADPPAGVTAKAKTGLSAPGYLPPLARQVLKKRMKRHGNEMLELVRAVLFLDRPVVQRLAADIAAEPRLTRPIAGGEDDVNATLPERFFVLQDQLRSRALALGEAAKGKSDEALAARLGEVTQTCVSCHSAYLDPTPAEP